MFEIIDKEPSIVENTKKAIIKEGVTPLVLPIRGGTDGAEISYMGIPCPNLGAGGHNFHSVYEYVCLEDMEKISKLLVGIIRQFSKKESTENKNECKKR